MPAVPPHLEQRWLPVDDSQRDQLVALLEEEGYAVDGSTSGLADHVEGRLDAIRRDVVPWLDDSVGLEGATVLEIGCGTGSSTVAIAEQGARVVGIDLRPDRVEIARARCAAHGLDADLQVANAVDLPTMYADLDADLVVFSAVLEHMTLDERLETMAGSWRMLRPGASWCVMDTPNRLWVYDGHTAHLPFFHWLPDDLAVRYAARSARAEVAALGPEPTPEAVEQLARQGRGVSYHEFDISVGPVGDLEVVSTLTGYRDRRSRARRTLRRMRPDRRVERVLRGVGPPLHPGFYEQGLNLVLRKR
jgi:2-polyprenyl-3-methyl-5-hydroxy-6-metoxy-1,4-benzoquinol methylase